MKTEMNTAKLILEEQIRLSTERLKVNHYPTQVEPSVREKIESCKKVISLIESKQQLPVVKDWDEVVAKFEAQVKHGYVPHVDEFIKFCEQNFSPQVSPSDEEIDEDIQVFIDGVERIKALVKNAKYGNAEQTKKELIDKLNDLV